MQVHLPPVLAGGFFYVEGAMIIVSAADERFAPHFASMMHSAWRHNPNATFYLLDSGISPATESALDRFALRYGMSLHIIRVNNRLFAGFPTSKHYSAAIYSRLLIPELLPTIDRALYVDADTAVVGDLLSLWVSGLNGIAVAGVFDHAETRRTAVDGQRCINSGVMLMNLEFWRECRITNLTLEYLARNPDLRWPDQTAINAVCAGRIRIIPPEWNITLGDCSQRFGADAVPRILHWTGPFKPWLFSDAPLGDVYLQHRNHTPFELEEPLQVYRSTWRRALNMALGRPKYWKRYLLVRHFTQKLMRRPIRVPQGAVALGSLEPQACQAAESADPVALSAGQPAPSAPATP